MLTEIGDGVGECWHQVWITHLDGCSLTGKGGGQEVKRSKAALLCVSDRSLDTRVLDTMRGFEGSK